MKWNVYWNYYNRRLGTRDSGITQYPGDNEKEVEIEFARQHQPYHSGYYYYHGASKTQPNGYSIEKIIPMLD